MKPLIPATLALAALAGAAPGAPAAASTPSPSASSDVGGVGYAGTNGGAAYGEPVAGRQPRAEKRRKRPAAGARPVLSQFRIDPRKLYPFASTPRVTFQVDGRSAEVALRLVVSWPDGTYPPVRVDLGRQATNATHVVELPQLADPALPEGIVRVRIAGRDTRKRLLRPGAHLSRVQQIEIHGHVFPLRGAFSYGSASARFGAARNGHVHQGQDLLAAEGTPIVAPRGGTIIYVGYQAGGAGNYVVLSGDGEDLDYAFMHLKDGSTLVVKGQHVATGQQLGGVGHTGDAEGDHLHFEVWQGTWYDGGKAVDPLPYLQQWQAWSSVTQT